MQRARRIFIESNLTENNITLAFEAYQSILAEKERELFLISSIQGDRNRTAMDDYERPQCPDCGSPMMFRVVSENEENVKTQLVCASCDLALNSENDLTWWMENLRKKGRDDNAGIFENAEADK